MYQLFSFTMLLALTTNNMGILWVAMEAATLDDGAAGQRLPHARPASRRRGSTSSCAASASRRRCSARCCSTWPPRRSLGAAGGALLWTHLDAVKAQLDPTIITLAFAFLFIGYGTKVGLVPLHNWLPDAHAEGPTPVSAVLSGLLLNVALYAVLRCKVLTDGALAQRTCRAT